MSVSGFTPAPSTTSATGSSPATSSSHQLSRLGPPKKQLKALEAATDSEDNPAKALGDSTDDDLHQPVDLSVPNVPDDVGIASAHLDLQNETFHDADDFVPNACRDSTLEKGTDFVKQVEIEVVETEKEETKRETKEEAVEAIMFIAPTHPECGAKQGEGEASKEISTARSTEEVGPQPVSSHANIFLQSSSSSSAARARSSPPSQSDEKAWDNLFKTKIVKIL